MHYTESMPGGASYAERADRLAAGPHGLGGIAVPAGAFLGLLALVAGLFVPLTMAEGLAPVAGTLSAAALSIALDWPPPEPGILIANAAGRGGRVVMRLPAAGG